MDFVITLVIYLFLISFSIYWHRRLVRRNKPVDPPVLLINSKVFKKLALQAYITFFNPPKTYAWTLELTALFAHKPCEEATFDLFLSQCTEDDLRLLWSNYDDILKLHFKETSRLEADCELFPDRFEGYLDRLTSLINHQIMLEFKENGNLLLAIENFKFNEYLKS